MKKQSGFTLLEMMIVVAIMGILVGLLVPNLFKQLNKAEIMAAESDLRAIHTQAKFYYLQNRRLPTHIDHLTPNYLPRNPSDPWGREYKLRNLSTRGLVAYTLGRDGREGGRGIDKDRYQKINLRGI